MKTCLIIETKLASRKHLVGVTVPNFIIKLVNKISVANKSVPSSFCVEIKLSTNSRIDSTSLDIMLGTTAASLSIVGQCNVICYTGSRHFRIIAHLLQFSALKSSIRSHQFNSLNRILYDNCGNFHFCYCHYTLLVLNDSIDSTIHRLKIDWNYLIALIYERSINSSHIKHNNKKLCVFYFF